MTGEKILTEKPKPSALLAPNSQSSLKKGLDLITDFAKYKAVEKEEEKKLEEMKTEQLKENAGKAAEEKLKEGMKVGQKDGPKEGAASADPAAAVNATSKEELKPLSSRVDQSQSSGTSRSLPFQQSKRFIQQLKKFFDSPFKEDRTFAVLYMAQLTRDKIHESEDAINALFYDSIFNELLNSREELNRSRAFDVLCNMVQSHT